MSTIPCLIQRRLFFRWTETVQEVEKQNLLKVNHMLELDVWLFGLQPIGWLRFRFGLVGLSCKYV